jgi:hypothetical protein
MKNQNMIVGCVTCAAIAGGLGFWGGTMYQKNQSSEMIGNQLVGRGGGMVERNQNGKNSNKPNAVAPSMNGRGNGAITGEVTAKDDKTITVKMNDGSSKNVVLSGSTTYRTSSESSLDNVEIGKTVAVFGSVNTDGSTTATSIEIDPPMIGQELKK